MRMHELYGAGTTPLAAYEPKCDDLLVDSEVLAPRLLAKRLRAWRDTWRQALAVERGLT